MNDELFSVQGKRIFISGGASGIGRMITEGLAERGARIFTVSRKQQNLEDLVKEMKGKRGFDLHAERADLSDMEQVDKTAQRIGEHFEGQLDVLINNSGATWGAPIEQFPIKGWDRCFDLNVKSLFRLSQQCLPYLEKAASKPEDPSRIINIGSISGISYPVDNAWAYHPAKAAVHHLTKTMAKGLAQRSITVNAIAPGFFHTNMTAFLVPEGDQSSFGKNFPLGRMSRASDIVGVVVYLASKAGSYTTGVVIPIDGGQSL